MRAAKLTSRQLKINQPGFTLIELVFVIVLLGIISVTALPKFTDRSNFDERAFFNDTLNAVRYAQKVAIATGCNTQFTITNNSYALLRDNSCTSGNFTSQLTIPHPSNGENAYTGSQNNVSLNADNNAITFDALGQANKDTTMTLGNRTITIIAATGFSYDSTP